MIAERMFQLMGEYDKAIDRNKNQNGEGILERFCKALGEDYDQELHLLVDNLLPNMVIPTSAQVVYLPALEVSLGNTILFLSAGTVLRRAVLSHIRSYYNIKGTERCYEYLFSLIGFNATISEPFVEFGFDSDSIGLDDSVRVFDSVCNSCTSYSLTLSRVSGTGTVTAQELLAIESIVRFNHPINATLTEIIYDNSILADFNYDFNLDYLS